MYGMNVICKYDIPSTVQTDVTFLLDVSWSALSSFSVLLGQEMSSRIDPILQAIK